MDVGECPGSRIILPQPFPASPDTSGFSGFVLGYSCGGSAGISPDFLHRPSESWDYWAIMARVSRGRSGTGAGAAAGGWGQEQGQEQERERGRGRGQEAGGGDADFAVQSAWHFVL